MHDTWAEYLEAASQHLRASRRAVEHGGPSPEPPAQPAVPLPEELQPQALRLALGYDQLALEVATRMADIESRHSRPRVEALSTPSYVDQMA